MLVRWYSERFRFDRGPEAMSRPHCPAPQPGLSHPDTKKAVTPWPGFPGCHCKGVTPWARRTRSEEHTSELQSLMRISYAVFCLKKKNHKDDHKTQPTQTNQNYYSHTIKDQTRVKLTPTTQKQRHNKYAV